MAKKIITPKKIPIAKNTPFRIFGREESLRSFGNGHIFSNGNKEVLAQDSKKLDSEEYYLNISYEPLSPQIKGVFILTKEEIEEKRLKEDDLLNAYIPLARNYSGLVNIDSFNGNPNFIRKNNEVKMSGYFRDGKIYLSGFVIFGPSNELISVQTNKELEAQEGQVLFLNLDAKIKIIAGENNELYISDLSLYAGSPESLVITNAFYLEKDNQEESNGELDFNFKFPIGLILNGDFISLGRGNIKIEVAKTQLTYYSNTESGENGRDQSIYETKYMYNVYPLFI